ncbi:hypothetical protein ACS0TY_013367 [Phlomoides rotata]
MGDASQLSLGNNLFLHINPCNCFQEFTRAVLKCFGLINPDQPQESSPNVKDDGPVSSAAGDPPPDPLLVATQPAPSPTPPDISGGRGPQNN